MPSACNQVRLRFPWRELVHPKPLTSTGQTKVPKALALMAANPAAGCIVVLHRRRVVGIVTRQDLIRLLAQKTDWSHQRLADVMAAPVITIPPPEPATKITPAVALLAKFEQHQIRHLPVVDDRGHLLGLIHQTQLLQALQTHGAPTQLHQHAQLLAEITLKIRQSLQLKEILKTTVQEVKRLLDADRVLIYQVFADGTGKAISEAVAAPYPSILDIPFAEEVFPTEYQTLYAQGRVQAITDVKAPNAGITDCLVEFVQQWDIQSKLIVPIVHPLKPEQSVGAGPIHRHLWGLLIVHQCRSPRQWADVELDLMQQLADQISIALSQGQMLEYLEDRVKLRTLELTHANGALQQEIQERKQVEAALRQSEEQLRLVTNNLPVLIAYVDSHQRYRFNNQAYEHWLGQAPAKIYGEPLKTVMGAEYYHKVQPEIKAALAGNQVTYESEILFKDGHRHSISVAYIPHIEATAAAPAKVKSKVRGFFALTTDISDRKAIERMKDEFIAVVSHELRTPLTSIHGSLKLMATGRLGKLSDAGQQMLEVADENTDRLVRLVNNVLDLQRIESGEVTMDFCSCDAVALIFQATEAMQTIAQQQNIQVQTQTTPLSIWADPDYIVQTLTNLVGNALKFSPPDNIIHLTVQPYCEQVLPPPRAKPPYSIVEPTASMALFCVQDYGQGIPTNKLNTIFERFQQVDSSDARKKGGTGLGLAICRTIVEQHGGQIWAESDIGQGSCFYFTVPLNHVQV